MWCKDATAILFVGAAPQRQDEKQYHPAIRPCRAFARPCSRDLFLKTAPSQRPSSFIVCRYASKTADRASNGQTFSDIAFLATTGIPLSRGATNVFLMMRDHADDWNDEREQNKVEARKEASDPHASWSGEQREISAGHGKWSCALLPVPSSTVPSKVGRHHSLAGRILHCTWNTHLIDAKNQSGHWDRTSGLATAGNVIAYHRCAGNARSRYT